VRFVVGCDFDESEWYLEKADDMKRGESLKG